MKKLSVKKWIWLCLCFFLLMTAGIAQDFTVGKITSFTGELWLDSFGSGDFALVGKTGEPLYKNSVLKTGNDAQAQIMVMDTVKEIFPQSVVSIEKVISLETRKKGAPWFTPLVDILHRITSFLFPGEKSVDFISRGEEKLSAYDKLFRFEEEGDESATVLEELNFLLKVQDLKQAGYTPGEFDYRKGFCYFLLGNYEAAAGLLEDAFRISGKTLDLPDKSPWFTNSLFLIKGINHYMLAEYDKAAIYLEKFINRNRTSEYAPYASWLLLDSFVNLSQQDRVREYTVKVRDLFKNHIYKNEFALYLEGIK